MRHSAFVLMMLVAGASAACNDTSYRIDPILVTDTVELAAPAAGSSLPSALDITSVALSIRGGRFPERAADAEQWDFAVRVRSGEVTLVPAAALGLTSRAALTRALPNTFESLVEAPGRTSFVTDSAVVMRVGEVYAARSRQGSFCSFGGEQYAKLQPLEIEPAAGRIRLLITTNERCGDPRLAEEG